jgi:TonB family protein
LGGIFVSYRRSDSQGEAGRLFDDLVKHFDERTVFMDVSAIEAGRDFRKAIEEGVTKCGVLLVVMGPEWLNAKDERGVRRLDDPADFVRLETAAALKRDIPVIPVLVRAARMPSAEQLPPELTELAYRNCIELTHARWKSDIQLLIEALRRLVGDSGQTGTKVAANAAAASAQPAYQAATELSKREQGSPARIEPAALQQVSRELALRIGPIADIVVKRAASRCGSIEDLYLKVAEEIDSPDERQKFLLKRATIPSVSVAAKDAPAVKNISGAVELPPLPKTHVAPVKTVSPPAETHPSSQLKYVLLAAAAGVFLILIIIFVMRSAPSKEASSSPSPPISPPERQQQPAPAKTETPPPVAATPPLARTSAKSEASSPQRVRLSEEVSKGLLITTIVPAYPPLARQAHVQGSVILDADISKDGTVEALRVVSGHPMLISAALDAVKQWRYKPYVVKGEPVPINTDVIVNFALSGGSPKQ